MKFIASALWLPCAVAVLFRRSTVPGGRVQLLNEDSATVDLSADGWVGGAPLCSDQVPSESSTLAPVELAAVVLKKEDQQDSVQQVVAETSSKAGRKRKAWQAFATERVTEGVELREATKTWLTQHCVMVKHLSKSTCNGKPSIVAACRSCSSCSRVWCFRFEAAEQLVVECSGECAEKNKELARLTNARKYGRTMTPAKALLEMSAAAVPMDERPSLKQLENQRRGKTGSQSFSSDCMGTVIDYLSNPPREVCILSDDVVCCEDKMRVPFMAPGAIEVCRQINSGSFLMDFTFKTNNAGLLLGAIGPVALSFEKTLPHMRFFPAIFLLSDKEDEETQRLAVRTYLREMRAVGVQITDGFFDCSCLDGAYAEVGDTLFLHRCLWHVKSNVKFAASKKDEVSGQTRLKRKELLAVILEWIDFSAWLPTDTEFDCFWRSVLQRMKSSSAPTDFDEPDMARYLERNIFDTTAGILRATWSCGLGCVPYGITTYAPNAIEVSHRVLKHLAGVTAHADMPVTELITNVCKAVASKIEGGDYATLGCKVIVIACKTNDSLNSGVNGFTEQNNTAF
jgi:hypothetical protein